MHRDAQSDGEVTLSMQGCHQGMAILSSRSPSAPGGAWHPAASILLWPSPGLCRWGEAGGAKAAQQLSAGKSETSPGCLIKPPCGLLEIHHTALEIVPTILTPLGRAGSTGRAFVWGFWTLLFPGRDVPRFVRLCRSAACRGGEKPSPAEGCGFIRMGTVCSAPAGTQQCCFACSRRDNAQEHPVLSSRAHPFAQSPSGKGSWIAGGQQDPDLGGCGDTRQHCGARREGAEGIRGGHCPVPPSQAGRSPRRCRFGPGPGPATAAGEAGGAAL